MTKNSKGIQIRRRIKSVIFGFTHSIFHLQRSVREYNCNILSSEENFIPVLIGNYHVIEKGLAMPNFRHGFGQERIRLVCEDIMQYIDSGFSQENIQFIRAVQAIDEYNRVHKAAGYVLDKNTQESIGSVLQRIQVVSHDQQGTTREEFFSKANAPFCDFALSRHSVRDFSTEEIPINTIIDCVEIARFTPTACNRQPNKTYIVNDKGLIKDIVCRQGGGRGFADSANKLLVVTCRTDVFSFMETMEVYKAGGMYTMTLLYALHNKGIGTCPLAWTENHKRDKWLHHLLQIPNKEEIIMLIAAGFPSEKFKYVTSERNSIQESLRIR